MKKHALTLIGVLSLLLAAGSAFAQSIDVRGDIPFSFIVNKATMPAGHYEVMSLSNDGRTLTFRDADGQSVALVNSIRKESLQAADQTKLIFTRYGDRYFLSQIWVAGETSGHQLPKSKREAEVAMDYNPERVVVLAELR